MTEIWTALYLQAAVIGLQAASIAYLVVKLREARRDLDRHVQATDYRLDTCRYRIDATQDAVDAIRRNRHAASLN